ncbi:PAP2 superfamily protein [Hymenobacter daecheongensis DSM 21074]|uniref:PAP2 superfamily protein n=1 Tax=Hymenobacter daecheongensis DSM 21074 TaxID=1121955 RepID=A0A1M6CSQ9_9BACT|nr:phosphatase PAP2 family protein [Hymenobacter daecheongensis]SHI64125.1 PAP2 superfamily protein [Hymenobacter daecheongensis DSM 21074]
MMFRYVLGLLLTLASSFQVRAQVPATAVQSDSIQRVAPILAAKPTGATPLVRRTIAPVVLRVGIPLTLIGVSYWGREQKLIRMARLEIREEALQTFPTFRTRLDDYTRRVPMVAAYALHLAGVKPARGAVPFSLIYLAAHQLNAGVTSNLKRICREPRPDNPTDFSSFPSSHTSEAFMAATLLHEQFGKTNPWISVGGYAVATATGAMRILHNKHWITDVVAGAGIGFLSAEAVWRAYPYAARLLPAKVAEKLLLMPTYAPGGAAGMVMAVKL